MLHLSLPLKDEGSGNYKVLYCPVCSTSDLALSGKSYELHFGVFNPQKHSVASCRNRQICKTFLQRRLNDLRTILATETDIICSASFVSEQAGDGQSGVRCLAEPTNRPHGRTDTRTHTTSCSVPIGSFLRRAGAKTRSRTAHVSNIEVTSEWIRTPEPLIDCMAWKFSALTDWCLQW